MAGPLSHMTILITKGDSYIHTPTQVQLVRKCINVIEISKLTKKRQSDTPHNRFQTEADHAYFKCIRQR